MKPAAITTVINFCTYDFRFVKACIEGVRPFSDKIIVTVCDHFFDGMKENYALLELVYRSFPDCQFIEYAFDHKLSYRSFSPLYPEHHQWRHEWHNTGRWIAYQFLPKNCEYILFLDCDEIVDPKRFTGWWKTIDARAYSGMSCAAHWHFREAQFEAQSRDGICLLFNKSELKSSWLWHEDERAGLLMSLPGKKLYKVQEGKPFLRHYSWVRTQAELQRKFRSWGHHWERPWDDLLTEEFSRPFNGVDFIRRYNYRTVEPEFDPLAVAIPMLPSLSLAQHRLCSFPHLLRVNRDEMRRKELEELYV